MGPGHIQKPLVAELRSATHSVSAASKGSGRDFPNQWRRRPRRQKDVILSEAKNLAMVLR